MKRFFIGALWGMIFYFVGYVLIALLVDAPALDAWNPLIALTAAILAAAGSWKGWLPGTRMLKDNSH